MIPKVALHSRRQDLLQEVADFQACRDSLTQEFVVCFYLFVRGFYKDFFMFITEAHKGLRPSDDFGYGQADVIQCFAYVQEDDGVHNVAQYLSSDGVDSPLGQRKQAEILFTGLDYALDIRASEVVCKQLGRSEFLVGEQHEVSELDRQPVLLLVFHHGVLIWMVQHKVALPLESIVLVHVHIGIDHLAEKFNLLPLAEVYMAATYEAVLALVQAGAKLVVERLERKSLGRQPANECLLRPIVESMNDLLGDVSCIQYKGVDGKTALEAWIKPNRLVAKQTDISLSTKLNDAVKLSSKKQAIFETISVLSRDIKLNVQRIELLADIKSAVLSSDTSGKTVLQEIERRRNMARVQGRRLYGKVIGTTLLTKGLEADTILLIKPSELFKNNNGLKHLYVALTRAVNRVILIDTNDN